jgi:TRAP-type C4-dicarboxylate transport system permease small subunit
VNKKQKILTVIALVLFVAIGAFHYLAVTDFYYFAARGNRGIPILGISNPSNAIVPDVKMPWFMLGVIYAAFFFVLQNKRGS